MVSTVYDALFSEQFRVRSYVTQFKHKDFIKVSVNQKKVWQNVAFSVINKITCKGVVMVAFRKSFSITQQFYSFCKQAFLFFDHEQFF